MAMQIVIQPNGIFVDSMVGKARSRKPAIRRRARQRKLQPAPIHSADSLGNFKASRNQVISGLLRVTPRIVGNRSEEHTSELQSHVNLVCRLLLEKKNPKPASG